MCFVLQTLADRKRRATQEKEQLELELEELKSQHEVNNVSVSLDNLGIPYCYVNDKLEYFITF